VNDKSRQLLSELRFTEAKLGIEKAKNQETANTVFIYALLLGISIGISIGFIIKKDDFMNGYSLAIMQNNYKETKNGKQ